MAHMSHSEHCESATVRVNMKVVKGLTSHEDPPVYFLDASLPEEAALPLRLLLMFSFSTPSTGSLQGMKLLGPGEIQFAHLKNFIKVWSLFSQAIRAHLYCV